ncbi:hypothetical protein PHMEG_00031686 [Phytophthora megakarya]|uniref:Uncharacterized protein n=1 Tax=Phytophthora megakarya TaxID=4795 RepID=A0A225UZZ8_9STRA|nr:hypothetical protein PHMEG_00031686 [Phytophthora megakarya]
MATTSLHADPLADVSATSIFETLFKSKDAHDKPEEDTEDVVTEEKEPKQQLTLPVKQPTLLADLHLLQQLTEQIQIATLSTASNNHDDDNERSHAEAEGLAILYCRRAAALLAFVDYDASTALTLDILASDNSDSNDQNLPAPTLEAVRQALQDSQAAVALTSNNSTLAEAYLLSAYCSRSLGELSHARASTALAATALPGSTAILNLAAQLDVEARTDIGDLLPKLRMTSAALSTLATSSTSHAVVHQNDEENNNDSSEQNVTKQSELSPTSSTTTTTIPTEKKLFWSQVATHFQVLEEASQSPWLEKLEHLIHLNVHHRCAQPNEVRQLDTTLQSALAALALLLQSNVTCTALGLDMKVDDAARTIEKLNQTASSSPQTFVQNRTGRKWLVYITSSSNVCRSVTPHRSVQRYFANALTFTSSIRKLETVYGSSSQLGIR